jgi:hypothetical protein
MYAALRDNKKQKIKVKLEQTASINFSVHLLCPAVHVNVVVRCNMQRK